MDYVSFCACTKKKKKVLFVHTRENSFDQISLSLFIFMNNIIVFICRLWQPKKKMWKYFLFGEKEVVQSNNAEEIIVKTNK